MVNMPWSSVDELRKSKLYASISEMHAWAQGKLEKFVSSFAAVYERAKRNGATDEKAESLALPIAFSVAKRTASAETVEKSESAIHYIAAMAPLQAGRDMNSSDIEGDEWRFTIIEKGLPLLRSLVAGLAANWDHNGESQIGVIRDIIPRSAAPPEVQAKTDPSIPFYFVASFRTDIPPESRNEVGVSAEWIPLGDGEALPLTFAKSHTPLNGPELGIRQVAASILYEPDIAATEVSAKPYHQQQESGSRENPNMNEQPPKPSVPDVAGMEAKVASLSQTLAAAEAARKEAETKAHDLGLQFAALKERNDLDHKMVEELKADALNKEADDYALGLVRDGKAPSDKVASWSARYKALGKEASLALAADLPVIHVGIGPARAAAVLDGPAIGDAAAAKMKEQVASMMKKGSVY
jgi:hypothetical protein